MCVCGVKMSLQVTMLFLQQQLQLFDKGCTKWPHFEDKMNRRVNKRAFYSEGELILT